MITHGELYVTLSRVNTKEGLNMVIMDEKRNISNTTTNNVYKEVLQGLKTIKYYIFHQALVDDI